MAVFAQFIVLQQITEPMVAGAALTASAEITFGTWGRLGTDVLKVTSTSGSDDVSLTTVGTPWWGGGTTGTQRLYVHLKNDEDTIGGEIYLDAGCAATNAQGYVRFLNKDLTLRVGGFEVDDLRGWIGDWGDVDAGQVAGESDIMDRFGLWGKAGLGLFYRPSALDGKLFVGAAFDANGTTGLDFKNYLASVQAGVGYDIGAALLKVVYLGSGAITDDDHNFGTIEVGANINAIENNLIQIGVKIPLVDNEGRYSYTEASWTRTEFADIAAGLSGNADAISYMAHLRGKFGQMGGTTDEASKMWLYAGVSGGVKIAEVIGSWGVGFTAKYDISTQTWTAGETEQNLGGSVFLEKPYSNGTFDIGLRDVVTITSVSSTNTTKNVLAVPVSVTMFF